MSGKEVALPRHHNLETYLHAYLEGTGIAGDAAGPLFRTIGRGTGQLTRSLLYRVNAYDMVQPRALAAGVATAIGNHTFRPTGITAYLKEGGTLEKAAAIANHASTRTTQLYDRCRADVSPGEVERLFDRARAAASALSTSAFKLQTAAPPTPRRSAARRSRPKGSSRITHPAGTAPPRRPDNRSQPADSGHQGRAG